MQPYPSTQAIFASNGLARSRLLPVALIKQPAAFCRLPRQMPQFWGLFLISRQRLRLKFDGRSRDQSPKLGKHYAIPSWTSEVPKAMTIVPKLRVDGPLFRVRCRCRLFSFGIYYIFCCLGFQTLDSASPRTRCEMTYYQTLTSGGPLCLHESLSQI